MSYSQQEYEMVRRQTIQMESEKRAWLRILLLFVSLLLAGAVVMLGVTYRLYRRGAEVIAAAESRAGASNTQLQQCQRELAEQKAQLDKGSSLAAQRQERAAALLPKVLSQTASQSEVAELARIIYLLPGRSVEVPRPAPNDLFTRLWRFRSPDQVQTFVLVGGQAEGKWLIYSNLIGTAAPQAAKPAGQ